MTHSTDIAELLQADRIDDAVRAGLDGARARPQDTSARLLLIDLLILAEDFARADAQADIAAKLNPGDAIGLSRLRGLLRGMEARRSWDMEGAVPAFPGGPSPLDQIALRLDLARREGNGTDAIALLEELDEARGAVAASVDGSSADDFRDLDDRLPHALEAVTDGGAYLWIDFAKIASVSIAAPSRPRDLAWRRAQLELRDGSAAEVLLPLNYLAGETTDALKLGRSTEWVEGPSGITTGRGQRCFLVGEEVRGIGEITEIRFAGEADG